MAIRYTKTTRDIINFIKEYGFITTKICSNIFYNGNKNPYHQARVMLNKLYNNGDLKRYECETTKEYIYQITTKYIYDHKKFILDLYSRIYTMCNSIEYFKIEELWEISKRKNDGHIIYKKDGKIKTFLIEFDKYHKTSKNKLNQIYESQEVQEWYKNRYGKEHFPNIIIITPIGVSNVDSDNYNVIDLDYSFNGLESIL